MTAGSGILHEEMIPDAERMLGVQLWLNLPKKDKWQRPNYHPVRSDEIEEIPFDSENPEDYRAGIRAIKASICP